MEIENEALFQQYAKEGINLFVGSGFSVHAESALGPLPSGDGLKNELIDHFGLKKPSRLSLAQVCLNIKSTKAVELADFLRRRFNVVKYDSDYKAIANLGIKTIFTTNIDNLVHKIYEDSQSHYLNDLLVRGPSIGGKCVVEYIPLHGCVAHEDTDFDFTPIELASSFSRDSDKWFGFVGRIQKTPTFYWGYRLEDAGVLQALHPEIMHGRKAKEAWVSLRAADEEAIDYFKSMGFQMIIGDTTELLRYFNNIVPHTPSVSFTLLSQFFPEFKIPSPDAIPARSITEFYSGAEPAWSDIYSDRLYETKHFLQAKNTIAQGKNTVLLGATATGKSTLLRQLASDFPFKGDKLFVNELSKDKARLLAHKANALAHPVLVFIDNIADASEGVTELLTSSYIQLVGAERDYFFDTVSHRFEKRRFVLQDVSGLTDQDIQEIENRVPKELVTGKFQKNKDHLSSIEEPTLFEVMAGTIRNNSLRERYVKTLAQLGTDNVPSHDLIALICYLYSCRVPTSVDVASAFLSHYSINVKEVHGRFESMGAMISSYGGVLADPAQDFVVPRSGPVSDAVIKALKNENLKRLLLVFHKNVSTTRIPRYDIFKRRAYDESLTSRAFPDVKEGIQFYENVYHRDPSPYLRQQGALYCSKRGDWVTAFNWIDEALTQTRDRNPTIRNTYAVILFQSNINKPFDKTVAVTLRESMEILKDCYTSDKRKVYHAKVFAEQAIKYADKLGSTQDSKEYLTLSLHWLDGELADRPGDKSMTSRRRSVVHKLTQMG